MGLDFLERAITNNNALEGKGLLQLINNGAGLVLLDEADDCVEEQQGANNTEVNPVLEASGKKRSSL